jgi:aspartate/methionine/tyrosine aminotransferase
VHLTYGTGPAGSPRLQKALAGFLKSRFHAREDVDPDNIVVMGGVGGINEAFTWSVCNEGEGIIIPRPLYTGFSQVIPARSRGVLIPATFQDLEGYKSLDDCFDPEMNHKAFEAAYMKATKDGITVKGVVIAQYVLSCSPIRANLSFITQPL